MKRLKPAMSILVAIVATWVLTTASAQSSIPNGVFVQDSKGWLWLVLDGKRVNVPVWSASDDDVLALPASDQWAVVSVTDAGAIVAGDIPAWVVQGGLYGPLTARPRPAATAVPTPSPEAAIQPTAVPGLDFFSDSIGWQATDTFDSVPIRMTIQQVASIRALPGTTVGGDYPPIPAAGKFVVVLVDTENVGNRAVCCPPHFKLRDNRGRLFSGDTSGYGKIVEQAMRTIYPVRVHGGDLQPNLPFRQVLVYDVPLDANSPFTLAPSQAER